MFGTGFHPEFARNAGRRGACQPTNVAGDHQRAVVQLDRRRGRELEVAPGGAASGGCPLKESGLQPAHLADGTGPKRVPLFW